MAYQKGTNLNIQGLNKLYNDQIISTQKVLRPGQWSGKQDSGFHQATKVNTKENGSYYIHNSPGNNTVITKNVSDKYKPISEVKPHSNYTVGNAMKSNIKPYNVVTNNCIHTANKVHKGK